MDTFLYELIGLEKKIENNLLLKIPFLNIVKGAITVIYGPNGAGKTTLLKILAFLETFSNGSLIYSGKKVNFSSNLTKLRREVTLVAQDAYLFNSSVAFNLEYGLMIRKKKREYVSYIDTVLKLIDSKSFLNKKASQLSGGEIKKVALARALILNPKVLLLDEPFEYLDLESKKNMEKIIKNLPKKGCSIVLVSHDFNQVKRLGNFYIKIEKGEIVPFSNMNI